MTYGKDSVITKETNKTIRSNALRTFISELNGSISENLFSLSPPDLANALAKIKELKSNNFRAQFANWLNGFKNENKYQGNNLRFDQKRQNNNTNKVGVITRTIIGHKREIFGKTIIKISIKNEKKSSQWMLIHRFNSRINLITIGSPIIIGRQIIIEVDIIIIIIKIIIVQPDGTVNQPANKVTRLNNINEDHFLDQTPTGECLI